MTELGMVMSGFSASDAAFTGLRVLRERPKTAMIWAGGLVGFQLVFAVMMAALVGPYLAQIQAMGATKPSPTQAAALMQHMAPLYLLLAIFFLIFYPIVIAAMNRVVLRPADDRFAYLRVGRDELRMLGVLALLFLMAIGAEIVAVIAGLIVGVLLTMVLKVAAAVVSLIVGVVLFCAWIFISVRLSLAFPQALALGRIDLRGSWTLSRGQFWPMLGAYVLAFVFTLIVYIVGYLVIFALSLLVGGGFGGFAGLFHPDVSLAGVLTPARLIHLIVGGFMLTLVWPLLLTPQAFIYRALVGDAGDGPAAPTASGVRPWA